MSDDPYVNWEVAPEGCNAVMKICLKTDGTPDRPSAWECWTGVKGNETVYDWCGSYWIICQPNGDEPWDKDGYTRNSRIFRPKEEIASAKERNDSPLKDVYKPFTDLFPGVRSRPDYSKMPEGTRIPDTVDMYQVHAYIKENLKLKTVRVDKDSHAWEMQLSLAGEVISVAVL